jgi:hypothetical protein
MYLEVLHFFVGCMQACARGDSSSITVIAELAATGYETRRALWLLHKTLTGSVLYTFVYYLYGPYIHAFGRLAYVHIYIHTNMDGHLVRMYKRCLNWHWIHAGLKCIHSLEVHTYIVTYTLLRTHAYTHTHMHAYIHTQKLRFAHTTKANQAINVHAHGNIYIPKASYIYIYIYIYTRPWQYCHS